MTKKTKKEVTIFTNETCPYCKDIKEKLRENKIKFTEKEITEFAREWYKITFLTKIPIVPTVVVGNEYLVSGRDFMNPEQAINLIDYITGPEYKEWPNELVILETLKTIGSGVVNQFNNLSLTIKELENKLKKENEKEKH